MAKAHRLLLAHIGAIARAKARGFQYRDILAAIGHRAFKFKGDVEMILDRALAATGDENHLLDPRLARLIDRILDQRPVHDRQHLFRDRLGRRQEAGAKAGNGKHGLADRFVRHDVKP